MLALYDAPSGTPWDKLGFAYSIMLRNLLGHFDAQVELKPVQQYTAGSLANYSATFYLGAAYDLSKTGEYSVTFDAFLQGASTKSGRKVTDAAGRFDLARLRDLVASAPVRAIEVKLSQGAKPGHGGVLPAAKITPEIVEARWFAADELPERIEQTLYVELSPAERGEAERLLERFHNEWNGDVRRIYEELSF